MAADTLPTYFELFGLQPGFDVDLELLDRHYLELQRTVHPDRFVNATDRERRFSMEKAAQINGGYQILKDPLQRGRYLLELRGFQFNDEHHTTSDTAFLMEQMEIRESLAEVKSDADPFAALGNIMERIDSDFKKLADELRAQLGNGETVGLEAIADTLLKMQFFRRLEQESTDLEAELEDELDAG